MYTHTWKRMCVYAHVRMHNTRAHTHTHLSFVSNTTRLMGIAIPALGVEVQTPTEKLPLIPN